MEIDYWFFVTKSKVIVSAISSSYSKLLMRYISEYAIIPLVWFCRRWIRVMSWSYTEFCFCALHGFGTATIQILLQTLNKRAVGKIGIRDWYKERRRKKSCGLKVRLPVPTTHQTSVNNSLWSSFSKKKKIVNKW